MPVKLGDIEVSVRASTLIASDSVTRTLHVEVSCILGSICTIGCIEYLLIMKISTFSVRRFTTIQASIGIARFNQSCLRLPIYAH